MTVERIEISHIDLEFEKNMLTQEAYIELHDNYFRYRSVYDSEVPKDSNDLGLGWKDEFHDFDIRIKRENIVSCDKSWNDKKDYWRIEIEANGYPETLRIFFSKGNFESMQKAYELLCDYIFKPVN